jgi:hypothetical protein
VIERIDGHVTEGPSAGADPFAVVENPSGVVSVVPLTLTEDDDTVHRDGLQL